MTSHFHGYTSSFYSLVPANGKGDQHPHWLPPQSIGKCCIMGALQVCSLPAYSVTTVCISQSLHRVAAIMGACVCHMLPGVIIANQCSLNTFNVLLPAQC